MSSMPPSSPRLIRAMRRFLFEMETGTELVNLPDAFVVRTYDPETGRADCTGPFTEAPDAQRLASRLAREMADDDPPMQITVEPLYHRDGSDGAR